MGFWSTIGIDESSKNLTMTQKSKSVSRTRHAKRAGEIRNRFKALLLQKSAKEGERISLGQVALATHINISTLSGWLNNRVTRYDADKLAALCEFFECKPGDLLEYAPIEQAK